MFWKSVARWISHAPAFGNASKADGGSVEAPCCTAPPSPYSLARDARQLLERPQIDLHVHPHLAVGADEAAVGGAGLHADLADADVLAALAQLRVVAAHERVQLVDVGVLAADLADLAADRDRHALGLVPPAELGEVGRELAVDRLLLVERGLVEIDERRGVDVDVVEARRRSPRE